jgi:flavin reductase (DIM6/NTAB) family NADH-FMN oxidoreductase RutF
MGTRFQPFLEKCLPKLPLERQAALATLLTMPPGLEALPFQPLACHSAESPVPPHLRKNDRKAKPMFYLDGQHKAAGLTYDPFKAIVAPRPIGWISAMSKNGEVNLSPYSFFNAMGGRPNLVAFSSDGWKDAVAFAAESGEFVCNLVTENMLASMNATSAPLPRGESEFGPAGLTMAECKVVKAPRVAESPTAMECKVLQIISPNDIFGKPTNAHIVLGQVVAVHIDDRYVENGILNTAAMRPLARCGYDEYAVVDRTITLQRPEGGY